MDWIGKSGFGYFPDIDRPKPELIRKAKDLSTPLVGDVMGRHGAMDYQIKAIREGMKVVGPAVTVRLRPADNLMAHQAIVLARPGDIIVVDTGGNTSNAPFGEIMCTACAKKGIAGLVIDGVIRDIEHLRKMDFPVFAKGFSPNGCDKDGPGTINKTITCGNVIVEPGDLIVGDDNGVAVVPKEQIEQVIEEARTIKSKEANRLKQIDKGDIYPAWLEKTIQDKLKS